MFVSEKLAFVELHKTGGTHIGRWLNELVGGQQIGKHNRLPPAEWGKFVIGSVRNPWDWYVSLWAYGCGGQGSVYRQTTRGTDFRYVVRSLASEMGRRRVGVRDAVVQTWHDARKPAGLWRRLYADAHDVEAFQQWLKLLLSSQRRFDMGEGFGFSPLSGPFGLMTYRYVKLFTRLGKGLYSDGRLLTLEGLRGIWRDHRLVDYIVRNERLEEDLLEALRQAGCDLSGSDRERLFSARNAKTNTSRRLPTAHYFDDETSELVAIREAFIIENHDYTLRASTSAQDG